MRPGIDPDGSLDGRSGGLPSYRPDIDGLRALAVLMVLGFHAFPRALPGGFAGVDVFFVISGFLISRLIIVQLKQGSFSTARFYAARIRRIFPALALVLAASFAIGWTVLLPDGFERLGKHIVAGAAFVANLTLWGETGYFDAAANHKPLLHLWSLGVEEQFYAIWPVLLATAWKRDVSLKLLVGCVLLGSLALSLLTTPGHSAFAFYFPLTRFWELMLGSLLAIRRVESGSSTAPTDSGPERLTALPLAEAFGFAGIAMIVASAAWLNASMPYPGWRALIPTIGTAFIIASGQRSRLISFALANRYTVGIGLISYPLYLWHWPLLSFAAISAGHTPSVPVRIVLLALSFALAATTFVLVESPIRFGAVRKRSVPVSVAMMLGAVGFGVFTYGSAGARFRFPSDVQRVLANEGLGFRSDYRINEKCWLAREEPFDGFAVSCFVPGTETTKRRILLWGDSYAGRLYPGLDKVLGASSAISQMTRDSCPPVLDVQYPTCIRSNAYVLQTIRRSPPDTVILAASWMPPEINVQDEQNVPKLVETLKQIKAAGVRRIVVFGPPPHWIHSFPRVVFQYWHEHHEIPSRMKTGFRQATKVADAALRSLIPSSLAEYVSLVDRFCDANGCLVFAPGETRILTTSDIGHLTPPAAAYAVSTIAQPD